MITLINRHSTDPLIDSLRRRRYRLVALAALAAGSLFACAPMPIATNPTYSTQEKIRSVSHWQILADQTAKAVPDTFIAQQKVLIVKAASSGSPFDQAFVTYLTGALTRRCLPTERNAKATAQCLIEQGHPKAGEAMPYITYGVVRVHHRDRDLGRAPMGTFTLLGAGIWLGHQASAHWSSASRYAAAPATGALVDLLSGIVVGPTHTEVIISVALIGSDGATKFRSDQGYYVEDADADEYPNEPLYTPLGPPTSIPNADIIMIKQP